MHFLRLLKPILPIFATLATLATTSPAQPVITEFLASNSSGLKDEDGEFSDWIEVHNPDATPVNLGGWHLTDDATAPAKWTFPAETLAPGGYLVVFASSKDRTNPAAPLHTNFKLSADGEYLALIPPGGGAATTEFAPAYPPQSADFSYGTTLPSEWIELFGQGSSARILVPANGTLGTGWRANAFNDSGWLQGALGVGYDRNTSGVNLTPFIATNVESQMYQLRTSVYVRVPFTVAKPGEILGLELVTRYEDGFAAHLNGGTAPIASANAPATLTWNSFATKTINDSDGIPSITTNLAGSIGSLTTGQNLIAFQGLNVNSGSSDMLVTGTLRARVPAPGVPPLTGYFSVPTPGVANGGNDALSLPETVAFSVPSRTFQGSLQVALSGAGTGQTIRYTTNGSIPTAASPLYSGVLTFSATTPLRARVFGSGGVSGPVKSSQYTRLAPSLAGRKSNLPMVILDARGQTLGDQTRVDGSFLLFDRKSDGASDLAQIPEISTRQGIRLRGSSSQGQPKQPYSVEFWDETGEDRDLAVLGMTAESDWVFYAPYNFDRNFTRNSIVYDLARQSGRWAPNTRFVEVFYNADGGDVTDADYAGVYAIAEQVKLDTKRIGFDTVGPSDVPPAGTIDPAAAGNWTGGYLLKIDRADSDEANWHTNANVPTPVAGTPNAIVLARPKIPDLDGGPYASSAAANSGSRQIAYIKSYVQTFETALYAERSNGFTSRNYLNFIDRDAWVDYLIVASFAKNVDALRLSAFFYKAQDQKLVAGPVWDFDRSLNSRDNRDDDFASWNGGGDATHYFEYDWWGALSADPDFQQAYYDRWAALRKSVFSDTNLAAVIDGYANEIDNSANGLGSAAQRDAQKWPSDVPRNNSYAVETSDLRSWTLSRAQWMDRRKFDASFLPPAPVVTVSGGNATITGTATLYYTTDGSDPRASGGGIAGQAYTAPVPLGGVAKLTARTLVGGVWSTPAVQDFTPADPVFLPPADGDWTTDANWSTNPAPFPDSAGVAVEIGAPAAANRAVTLRAPVTVGEIDFPVAGSTFRNRIQADGTGSPLTFSRPGSLARIEVSGTGTGFVEFQNVAGTNLANALEINVINVAGDPDYGALRLREAWSGAGGLLKTGAGLASLTGAGKSYSGATTISQGVLSVTQPAAMTSSASVTVTDGGQLRLTSGGTAASPSVHTFGGDLFLAGTGRGAEIPDAQNLGKLGALRYDPGVGEFVATVTNAIAFTALADLHVDGPANILRLTGALRGAGTIRKTGGGTLEITAANVSFTGDIDVQNGSLRVRGGIGSAIFAAVDGVLDLAGDSGALSGAGQLILPATAVHAPSLDGLQRSLVFHQTGAPDLADPTNSGNAVIVTSSPGVPLVQDFYVDLPGPVTAATVVRGGYLLPAAAATAPLLSPVPQVYIPSPTGTRVFAGKTWALENSARVTAVPTDSGRMLELRFNSQPVTYDEWKTANFSGPELGDPSISDPDATPYHDGIRNLLRYALGVPAGGNAAAYLPGLSTSTDGTVTFPFPFDPGLRGLRWTVQASANPADWASPEILFDSGTDLLAPDASGALSLTVPISGNRHFYRLKVAADASR